MKYGFATSGGRPSLVIALLVTMLYLVGCNMSNEIRLNDSHNGSRVELTQGQALFIALESNPTTGYSWQAIEVDNSILRQVGDPVFQASSAGTRLVGAGGIETFRFESVNRGTAALKLGYRRPWETGIAPIKIFSVGVTIK